MLALFVASTFVAFILTESVVRRFNARKAKMTLFVQNNPGATTEQPAETADSPWQVPAGIHITPGHTWIRKEENGEISIGLDRLVGYAMGMVQGVIPPRLGVRVRKGDPLYYLAFDGGVLTVASPLSGRVSAVHESLSDDPEPLVSDPYGMGWVCSVIPKADTELAELPMKDNAAGWMHYEFERYAEFVTRHGRIDAAVGVTLQDGGIPAEGSLAHLNPSAVSSFTREFM